MRRFVQQALVLTERLVTEEELLVMEGNQKHGIACSLSKMLSLLLLVLAACLCGQILNCGESKEKLNNIFVTISSLKIQVPLLSSMVQVLLSSTNFITIVYAFIISNSKQPTQSETEIVAVRQVCKTACFTGVYSSHQLVT